MVIEICQLLAAGSILKAGFSEEEMLQSLVEEIDTVILAANVNNKIMILHSPKNFGGTRSRPDNNEDPLVSGDGQTVSYQPHIHANIIRSSREQHCCSHNL